MHHRLDIEFTFWEVAAFYAIESGLRLWKSRTIQELGKDVPARTCPAGICRMHLWLSTLKSSPHDIDIP